MLSNFWASGIVLVFMANFALSCTQYSAELLVVEAQSCLNDVPLANPSAAGACLTRIDSFDSPEANQLKCSGAFIIQGFSNPTRLTKIAEQLGQAGAQGSINTLGAIGLLSFTGSNPIGDSEKALVVCQKSGSRGMTLLASMSNLATIMSSQSTFGAVLQSNCTNPSAPPQNCASAVRSVVCDNTNPAASNDLYTRMGAVAILTYNSTCRLNASADPMCRVYADATINGALNNPFDVGQRLKNYLTDPNGTNLCAGL